MSLKQTLARWLDPETSHRARRYERMRMEAANAYWWLGEFPAGYTVLRWLLDNDFNYNRALGEPARGPWRGDISEFREQLRRGEHERLHAQKLADLDALREQAQARRAAPQPPRETFEPLGDAPLSGREGR